MSREFTAPTNNGREKRKDIPKLKKGLHPAILFGMVDMGTHSTNFGTKRQIALFFEFPLEKHLFYIDDTVKKPKVLSKTITFNLYKNEKKNTSSNLYDFMSVFEENGVPNDNVMIYLNKPCLIDVVHKLKNGVLYENIGNVLAFNETFIKGHEDEFVQTNESMSFHLDWGFDAPEFGSLYSWIRKTIQGSVEGMEHAKKGGVFAEPIKKDEEQEISSEQKVKNQDAEAIDDELGAPDGLPF